MLSKVIIYFIISYYRCILCCLCSSLKLIRNTANLSVCSDLVLHVGFLWVPQPRNSAYRGCPLHKAKRQLLACALGVAVVGVVINEERKKKKDVQETTSISVSKRRHARRSAHFLESCAVIR